jgi:hypothetical protein
LFAGVKIKNILIYKKLIVIVGAAFAARRVERDNEFEPDISAHIIDPLVLLGDRSYSASVVGQKILIVA